MVDRLNYVAHGSGTPMIFVHGFTVDHHVMLPFEGWIEDGWQRIYVDLPGFGESTAGPEIDSADAVARALDAFIDDIVGKRQFAIVGNSFGGSLARHIVAERGDQVLGLGLLCPVVTPPASRALPARTVLQTDTQFILDGDPEAVREYRAIAVEESSANFEDFQRFTLPGLRSYDRGAAERIRANYELSIEPESRIEIFDRPSWMVTARQDHVVGYRDQTSLLSTYTRMTHLTMDGAGHNAHLDRPALMAAIMSDWFRRLSIEM